MVRTHRLVGGALHGDLHARAHLDAAHGARRGAALALGRRLGLSAEPRLVDAVLDDAAFMRQHRGEIHAHVCKAVHEEA